jgi:hypothetical protein
MKQLVENLVEQLVKDRTPKVKKSVVSEILGTLFYDNIDKELFGLFVQDVKNNSIYKSLDFLDGTKMSVNIFDYLINQSYIPIMKTLFGCKPNIGTPNAQTGEFEIALLLTIPDATKPTSGDIQTPLTGVLNIKAEMPRIFSDARGNDLNKEMLSILKKHKVLPIIRKKIEYGQLLNENYIVKFKNQFEKLSKEEVIEILFVWLKNLFPNKKIVNSEIETIINKSLNKNQIIWDKWVKENMIYFFKHGKNRNEKYVIMNENGGIFNLSQNVEEFEKLVTTGIIKFGGDYCRLNQKGECGIYLNVKF